MIIHVGTLMDLPAAVRTIVLVGNRSSDHLRELVRIAEFKGRSAYRIESAAELQPRWFVGTLEVGIVVGATGLDAVLREVTARLRQFADTEAQGMLGGIAK